MKKVFTVLLAACAIQLMATNHQVAVVNSAFQPKHIYVALGDTVTWTNNSGGSHNVNGTQTTFSGNPASFGNGAASSSAWTYSYTFTTAGLYNYQCDPHAAMGMVGTVMVTAPCTELYFSEYLEGSSNNKALEIYNPKTTAVNLLGYNIKVYNNGDTTVTNSFTFPNQMLAAHGTYVIANSQAVAAILNVANTTGAVTFYNGDDAVVLFKNNDTLDIIGIVGFDPGNSWTVGTGATGEYTLVRKNTISVGQTDWNIGATEWDVHPQNTTTFLGSHTSVCSTPPNFGAPLYDIADVRTVDVDGEADSLNVYCALVGTVQSIDFDGNAGYSFYITDGTAGINIFNAADVDNYVVTIGDSILVRGDILQFNGLIELVPDSIALLTTGNTLAAPVVVTVLDESTESELVRINNLTLVTPSQWPAAGVSANVDVTNGITTFLMRVDSDTDIDGSAVPTGAFDLVGIGNQFDNSSPYTSGYQILPRSLADIIPVVVTTPTINFPSGLQTVSESAGQVTITLPVNPAIVAPQTAKIYVSNGVGITAGDYTTTPAAVADTIVLNFTAGGAAQFTVNVLDDQLTEAAESITFTIAKVTSGLTVGPVATHVFTIADNDITIPTYPIPVLRTLDANFLPDSLGVMCKIVGTVLGVDMQGTASTNVSFTVHDGNTGYGVFMPNATYTVVEGDQVRVIGVVGHFNGVAQLNADSIVFISAGNLLPAPKVVPQINETTESDLVRFNNCYVINAAQWTNAGSGFSVDVTNGTDTLVLRVDKDATDVFAAPAPIGNFDLIGIGGQFDNSAPHNSGYQLLPRYLADLVFPQPLTYQLAITEILPGSNDLDPMINPDWFEITNYGTTSVDLIGFSWDDDSEVPGTVTLPSVTIAPNQTIVVWAGVSANETLFANNWGLLGQTPVTIISSDEMTGSVPGLGQGGDAVVLYDTSATPIEICKAVYITAVAGFGVEFDTNCTYLGNAVNGQNGAYTSFGGDVGSPGNVAPNFGLTELALAGIMVYPNPAAENVVIELPAGDKIISLTNSAGVQVLHLETSELQQNLNIGHLPSGIYMLQVSVDGKQAIGKLVKN